MATEVSICNLALGHIGNRAQITAITPPDGSQEARICSIFYPIARDSLLEKRDWGFARSRSVLADLGSPPAEWLYRYAMPSNLIRPLYLHPNGEAKPTAQGGYPFIIEDGGDAGTVILSNVASAELVFTTRIANVNRFSPSFREALSYWLGSYIAGPLTKDVGLADKLSAKALAYLGEASQTNANIERQQTKDNIARKYPIPAPRRSV